MDDGGGDAAAKARVDLHKAKLEKMKALDEHLARLSLSTTELKASCRAARRRAAAPVCMCGEPLQHWQSCSSGGAPKRVFLRGGLSHLIPPHCCGRHSHRPPPPRAGAL
jgi:hypothetical protein